MIDNNIVLPDLPEGGRYGTENLKKFLLSASEAIDTFADCLKDGKFSWLDGLKMIAPTVSLGQQLSNYRQMWEELRDLSPKERAELAEWLYKSQPQIGNSEKAKIQVELIIELTSFAVRFLELKNNN